MLQENDATQKAKREEAKKKRASTTSLPTVEGYRIEFEDLRLKLPTGVTIMRGPSGALEPGKSTAIMGASGAGKTTIMNLITHLFGVQSPSTPSSRRGHGRRRRRLTF